MLMTFVAQAKSGKDAGQLDIFDTCNVGRMFKSKRKDLDLGTVRFLVHSREGPANRSSKILMRSKDGIDRLVALSACNVFSGRYGLF